MSSPPPTSPRPQPPWLPPLNSHDRYTMAVQAFERHTYTSEEGSPVLSSTPENPLVKVHVYTYVYFVPCEKKNNRRFFRGLEMESDCYQFYSDLSSTVPYSEEIFENLFGHMFSIPFEFSRVYFSGRYKDPDEFPMHEPIDGFEDLLDLFSEYVMRVKAKPNNQDRSVLYLGLKIGKTVRIPDQEFEAWNDWYDEKKRSDRFFQENYLMAISRPRRLEEIIYETALTFRPASRAEIEDSLEGFLNDEKERLCSICKDEIPIGSECSRLSCSHGFHVECITRWLLQSRVCPICRFSV